MTGDSDSRIAIIDVGSGNIPNVNRAFRFLGAEVKVLDQPAALDRFRPSHLVLPGVGQFGSVLSGLRSRGWEPVIRDWLASVRPFLGICVGLQILLDGSEESPTVSGLGLVEGRVQRFSPLHGLHRAAKIPHMGWNEVRFADQFTLQSAPGYAYFVHSYYAPLGACTGAVTQYSGVEFSSALQLNPRGVAVQFHPEKSGPWGLQLLHTFTRLDG